MRFLISAVLLIIASFISVAAAGNIDNKMKTKYFDFDFNEADLVDFTIQQAPIDASALLTNSQIGATPLNVQQPHFSTLPNVNLQAQPMMNTALLNQMQAQQQALQSLTPQQYQQLLQQQTLFANPLVGAQTVMSQLFPQQQQQQQAALNAAAYGYNPYAAAINPYANQFAANPLNANNPTGVAGLVQQTAQQIAQAMNPGMGGPGMMGGGVGNPFGPGVGGLGGMGGIGGPGPFGPRP